MLLILMRGIPDVNCGFPTEFFFFPLETIEFI